MALEPCRECGREISSTADKCPHCGVLNPTPTRQQASTNALLLGCGLPIATAFIIALIFMVNIGGNSTTTSPPRSTYTAPAASSSPTSQQMAAVRAVLESSGARVETSGSIMRVHLPMLDVTELQAQQTAKMAYDRLGGSAIVYVYDRSGLERASASMFGVD